MIQNFSLPRDRAKSISKSSTAETTTFLLSGFSYANAKYYVYDNVIKGMVLTPEGQELLKIQLKDMMAGGKLTEDNLDKIKNLVDVYTRKRLFGDFEEQ